MGVKSENCHPPIPYTEETEEETDKEKGTKNKINMLQIFQVFVKALASDLASYKIVSQCCDSATR